MTAGTVFHGTRVPLHIWFLGLFFLARHKKGIPALRFQRDTGVGTTGVAIEPQETTVFTDAWGSYAALGRLGIDHRPRKGGRVHPSVYLLPWAHTVFGNLKTWLRGTFHVSMGQRKLLIARSTGE